VSEQPDVPRWVHEATQTIGYLRAQEVSELPDVSRWVDEATQTIGSLRGLKK